MPVWVPPNHAEVIISLNTVSSPHCSYEQSREAILALWKEYGIPLKDPVDHAHIKVSYARWPELLAAIDDLLEKGKATLNAGWIEARAAKPTTRTLSKYWYELHCDAEIKSFSKVKEGCHLGGHDQYGLVASQDFIDLVRERGLTGLESLPVIESAASDRPWYQIFAVSPIGRGLDHPLLDYAAWLNERSDRPKNEERCGVSIARQRWLRPGSVVDHPAGQWLLSRNARFFGVLEQVRYVREHLPDKSFAYSGTDGYDGSVRFWPINSEFPLRGVNRALWCNASARAAILEAGLLRSSRFVAHPTVLAADADVEILDRTVGLPYPPPRFETEQIASERARRLELARRIVAAPKPPTLTIEEIESQLRARIKAGQISWTRAEDDPILGLIKKSRTFIKTPRTWQRIVSLLPTEAFRDADTEDESFAFFLEAPSRNTWKYDTEPDGSDADDYPRLDDIVIASSGDGDWFAVRKRDPLMPEDAAVIWWDHETTLPKAEWATIAEFVEHVVAVADASTEQDEGDR